MGDGLTVHLLEHALDGAGAAAAGHGDVEFVGVLGGHCCGLCEGRWCAELDFGCSAVAKETVRVVDW